MRFLRQNDLRRVRQSPSILNLSCQPMPALCGPGKALHGACVICRATFVAAGGISALVHSLQEGSSRAKAAAVELLLGFAMDGVDNQEWIGAAPGAIPSLVDMLRCQGCTFWNKAEDAIRQASVHRCQPNVCLRGVQSTRMACLSCCAFEI